MCEEAGGCNCLSSSIKPRSLGSEVPGELLDLMQISLYLRDALVVLDVACCLSIGIIEHGNGGGT